jgi:hypothetical protein
MTLISPDTNKTASTTEPETKDKALNVEHQESSKTPDSDATDEADRFEKRVKALIKDDKLSGWRRLQLGKAFDRMISADKSSSDVYKEIAQKYQFSLGRIRNIRRAAIAAEALDGEIDIYANKPEEERRIKSDLVALELVTLINKDKSDGKQEVNKLLDEAQEIADANERELSVWHIKEAKRNLQKSQKESPDAKTDSIFTEKHTPPTLEASVAQATKGLEGLLAAAAASPSMLTEQDEDVHHFLQGAEKLLALGGTVNVARPDLMETVKVLRKTKSRAEIEAEVKAILDAYDAETAKDAATPASEVKSPKAA